MSDSTTRPNADEDWDDLLRQLPYQPSAQPRPFFYNRVQARLAEASAEKQLVASWLRRPAYVALLGALVLMLTSDCAAAGSATGTGGPGCQAQR
jgi:hypothetical protein